MASIDDYSMKSIDILYRNNVKKPLKMYKSKGMINMNDICKDCPLYDAVLGNSTDDTTVLKKKINHLENLKKSFASMHWYEWVMAAIMIFIAGRAMYMAFAYPTPDGNPAWLTVLNFISAVCGCFCIFFCAKASVSNFAFGLVNTIVYAIYLWYWKIYGTFALEMIVYLPFNIGSWIVWARHRDEQQSELTKARKLDIYQYIIVVNSIIISTIIYHLILEKIGGTTPWLDAATVAIGIIATALELMRFREQYVLWLITDVVAVAMYIQHFDPVYLTKKSIYLIMAIVGLYNWWKLQKRNEANE